MDLIKQKYYLNHKIYNLLLKKVSCFLCHLKMSNTPKKLRYRLEKRIDSGPLKINKIEIITRKVLEELEISKINETKNLEEIEMKVLMLIGKMKFEKIRNRLYEF